MTLEPPITQRDIDDAVTFRTRGGGTARISTNCTSDYFPWVVEFSDAQVFPMTASGSYCICGCCNHSRDLISRIPEPAIESQVVDGCCPKHGRIWVTDGVCRLCRIHGDLDMESQVVVEDRRKPTDAEPPWMGIDELTSKTIFEVRGDKRNDVYMTVYGHHVICLTNKASYHDATTWCVRPLPHLRLRLVLEERA